MPSTPRSPIVLRQRVTMRILLAASTRSLLLISLATAAAISGVSPAPCRFEHFARSWHRREATRGTRRRSVGAMGERDLVDATRGSAG